VFEGQAALERIVRLVSTLHGLTRVSRLCAVRAPDTNLCAFHTRRVTITPKDMQVRRLHSGQGATL
jgi:hypothetical protein